MWVLYLDAFIGHYKKKSKSCDMNWNFLKCFHTQQFRNCCSAALKLVPDTHHGCVLIPGIYNRLLVFSNQLLLPPFLTRKWTDKSLAGAFFQYKNCNDFFPGQQHRFHSYQLKCPFGKLFSQYITLTMPISVFFCLSPSLNSFLSSIFMSFPIFCLPSSSHFL